MVISLASSANVDQYTSNVSAIQSQMQTADSAINSVVTSLNTAITLGGAGSTGTSSAANDQALAAQAQGVLSSVISQANTSFQGVYLFGGSANGTPPFVAASTTYTSQNGIGRRPAQYHYAADRRFGNHHQRRIDRPGIHASLRPRAIPSPPCKRHFGCRRCRHPLPRHHRNHQCQRRACDLD